MKPIKLLVLAVLIGGLASCDEPAHKKPHAVKEVKVQHLKSGRYAYEDSTGSWWWYYSASGGSTASNPIYYAGSPSGLSTASLAVAGKGPAPTEADEEGATETEVSLDVMATGEPAIETTTEGATSVDSAAGDTGGGGDGGGGGGGDGGD